MELAYSPDLALDIFVPRGTTNLESLSRSLPRTLATRLSALRAELLDIQMPRWRAQYTASLRPALESLGVRLAFSGQADLSATCDARNHVSDVVHGSRITVDEHGTEAAAATAVVEIGLAGHGPPPLLSIDRPFLYLIRHVPTGVVLFVGQVADPE